MPEMPMKKTLRLLLCAIICSAMLVSAGCNKPSSAVRQATDMVDAMANGDFTSATRDYDATYKIAMPVDRLRRFWVIFTENTGAFVKYVGTKEYVVSGRSVIDVACIFDKANWYVRVVFDKSWKIDYFEMIPDKASVDKMPQPAYVHQELFTEESIVIVRGKMQLQGVITRPKGKGLYTLIVIVPGVGMQDRDGTADVIKPYKNIAWGLASRGIATLRYDKCTYGKRDLIKYIQTSKTWNVKDEYIYDVISAVRKARNLQFVDSKNIYLFGHGVGGYLIPMIAQTHPEFAGYIISSGYARPLEDAALDMVKYRTSIYDPGPSAVKTEAIAAVSRDVMKIKSLKANDKNYSFMIGEPPSFWLSLQGYHPSELAKSITKPMLVMHGERSYESTMKDYHIWNTAIGSRANVTMRLYTDLNNLYMKGLKWSTPSDYGIPGFVDERVINDISVWIHKQRK